MIREGRFDHSKCCAHHPDLGLTAQHTAHAHVAQHSTLLLDTYPRNFNHHPESPNTGRRVSSSSLTVLLILCRRPCSRHRDHKHPGESSKQSSTYNKGDFERSRVVQSAAQRRPNCVADNRTAQPVHREQRAAHLTPFTVSSTDIIRWSLSRYNPANIAAWTKSPLSSAEQECNTHNGSFSKSGRSALYCTGSDEE